MNNMNNYHFECVDCGKKYSEKEVEYLCPKCSKNFDSSKPLVGVLKIVYDYKTIKKSSSSHDNKSKWYNYLWPYKNGDGLTPQTSLYNAKEFGKKIGLGNLWLKDDTLQKSGSYKDRATSLVVKRAISKNKKIIVCASTGNAAASLAVISASEHIKSVVIVPSSTRPAKLVQMAICGANVVPIDGTYDDAFELSLEMTEKAGWYNRNTAYNPFTIEGKKSSVFEIWEQLGFKAPDCVIVPTGDGVILAGISKGFEELELLGWIRKRPRIIAVQPEKSNSVYLGWKGNKSDPIVLKKAHSVADSLVVNAPKNGRWAIQAINKSNGVAITVTDEEILNSIKDLGSNVGIFAEPAGAIVISGLKKLIKSGIIKKNDLIVGMITGNGLKDIVSATKSIVFPKTIKKNWRNVLKRVSV